MYVYYFQAIEQANEEFTDGDSSEYAESESEDGDYGAGGAGRDNDDHGDAEI